MSDTQIRRIPDRLDNWLRSAIFSWQSLLLLVAIAIFVANSFATPYFLNPWSISDSTFNFTEKALIALAMALVIISGEIDLSVAAIIAFCSTMMGFALQFGVGTPGLVVIGITTGLLCGAFNGVLVGTVIPILFPLFYGPGHHVPHMWAAVAIGAVTSVFLASAFNNFLAKFNVIRLVMS